MYLDVSLISIHLRRTKLECVSHSKTHSIRILSVHVTDLVTGWDPYGTNMRRALSYAIADLVAGSGHC
jgi:hypothetical protein